MPKLPYSGTDLCTASIAKLGPCKGPDFSHKLTDICRHHIELHLCTYPRHLLATKRRRSICCIVCVVEPGVCRVSGTSRDRSDLQTSHQIAASLHSFSLSAPLALSLYQAGCWRVSSLTLLGSFARRPSRRSELKEGAEPMIARRNSLGEAHLCCCARRAALI